MCGAVLPGGFFYREESGTAGWTCSCFYLRQWCTAIVAVIGLERRAWQLPVWWRLLKLKVTPDSKPSSSITIIHVERQPLVTVFRFDTVPWFRQLSRLIGMLVSYAYLSCEIAMPISSKYALTVYTANPPPPRCFKKWVVDRDSILPLPTLVSTLP